MRYVWPSICRSRGLSIYSQVHVLELWDAVASLPTRSTTLVERLLEFNFRTSKAEEFATHGLARRVQLMAFNIRRVFEALPPELRDLPTDENRQEATTHIQSIVFHSYGCFDNLAHIWVAERDIRRPNKSALSLTQIGFTEKCMEVRQSLPRTLQERLVELDPWLKFLEGFRHSSAHRIPLYIPPFVVNPLKADEYNSLSSAKTLAAQNRDWVSYDSSSQKQKRLASFRPMVATSLADPKSALFHQQVLADYATVEEWSNTILAELVRADGVDSPLAL